MSLLGGLGVLGRFDGDSKALEECHMFVIGEYF